MASYIRVTGTEGEVRVEPAFYWWDDRKLHFSHGDSDVETEFEQVDQMEEFEYFAHCLLTDSEPYADGEHGLTNTRVLKAVYRAAESEQVVEL